MRILFIIIVVAALGYLGWTYKGEIEAKLRGSRSPEQGEARDKAPDRNAGEAPIITPATPAPKRIAPPGVYYLTERVSMQTDVGVKGLNPGEEVKLMYRNKDGTARVMCAKGEFTVKEKQLTNDVDAAARAVTSSRL